MPRDKQIKNVKLFSSLSFFLMACIFSQLGCRQEKVPKPYRPKNAYDAYVHSLRQAQLDGTALGLDWIAASRKSFSEPVGVTPPFEEVFYADPREAFAVGYRFSVKRGQRIEIEVVFSGEKPAKLFIDLFRAPRYSGGQWTEVASADEANRLRFEPRRNGVYVVRLQPELLRGGQFKVTIRNVASLVFPVSGKDGRAMQSGFDAPREGGRRHNGVDIFAERHTPVLAPAKSIVRAVGENVLGGNVIWLYDPNRSQRYYLAHLETQNVATDAYVEEGQVVGTVGNSGNARTTPPHLHFGIYVDKEGPIDPFYFLNKTPAIPPPVKADLRTLGRWIRSKAPKMSLKESPESESRDVAMLDPFTPMIVRAVAAGMYRIVLPSGVCGYAPADKVETADDILEKLQSPDVLEVKEAPGDESVSKGSIARGEVFSVLGRFKEFWFVRTRQELTGWLRIPTPAISGRQPSPAACR